MKIAMFGVGYVGLVTGTCFSEMGNSVTCVDIDTKKIANLKRGKLPIYEPGLEEMVLRNQSEGRLSFTSSLEEAIEKSDILFIAVGTPSGEDGSADLQYVLSVARSIANTMTGYKIIVNKSTVPVGTGEKVKAEIKKVLQDRNVSCDFDVVSNPEFLKEGTAIEDFMRPDRVVVGTESSAPVKIMESLYEPFIRNGHPIFFMGIRSAEMTKYAANAMLATKISFMNEMANLCDKLGANIDLIRVGIGSDSRIGMAFLYSGLGYGGSCFPKDVRALQRMGLAVEEPMSILNAVEDVNNRQKDKLFQHIISQFGSDLTGKQIAIWGLAFKPGTDDVREAPSIELIKKLLNSGAKVVAYDPEAASEARHAIGEHEHLYFVDHQYDATEGVDALCLVTEWKVFRKPDFQRMLLTMKRPVIFDGRNQYNPEELAQLGFDYVSIGRGRVNAKA